MKSSGSTKWPVYSHPLVAQKLTLMRDRMCSTDKFRRLMREIGMFLAFEVTREFSLERREVEAPPMSQDTPIRTSGEVLRHRKIVIVPILRSGLVLADGILDVIPNAIIGHVGLVREANYTDITEYMAAIPEIGNSNVILVDPIIGTGTVASYAIRLLREVGVSAEQIRFATVLAAPEGLTRIHQEHPDVKIFPVSIEEGLDNNNHIYPGFGDSSTRLFGK